MRTIAIEEHFTTPMYRENVPANEFRDFYLRSRSEQLGHDIVGVPLPAVFEPHGQQQGNPRRPARRAEDAHLAAGGVEA